MDNTLFYFFSTLAQSFAALTAFVFSAAQFRISWLDQKITSLKKGLLYSMNGFSMHNGEKVDYLMHLNSTSEVIKSASNHARSSELCGDVEKLKSYVLAMQLLRSGIKKFVIMGLLLTGLGLLGLAITPFLNEYECFSYVILFTCVILSIWSLVEMGLFIYNSLTVSLKIEL